MQKFPMNTEDTTHKHSNPQTPLEFGMHVPGPHSQLKVHATCA